MRKNDPGSRGVLRRAGRTGVVQVGVILAVSVLGVAVARPRATLVAQDAAPTYAKDVAPILNRNCTGCHRPEGLGPFSLMDYDSAKKNVKEMKEAVATGYMPPWHADGPHGTFRNDRRLSDIEKQTLIRWIDGGAKAGDLRQAPPKPVYTAKWEMGTPDAVVTMPEEFTVPASGTVEYQYFRIPTNFTEEKWIQALEIMPGAREVVHHVLVYAYVPPAPPTASASTASGGAPAARPAPPRPLFVRKPQFDNPPDPPRLDTLHGPPRQIGALVGSTAPGTNVVYFPEGTALRMRAGTILTFQMHYTVHGHEMKDRTSVGLRFAKGMPDEEVRASAFINGNFTLPAGQKDIAVTSELEPTETVKIWGLLPHTHLRGMRWKYELQMPDGTKQVVLDVPRYDFNWQTYYMFTTPLEIPAGAKLISTAWYDNSADKKTNPDPTKDVHWGDQTWEEMQYTGYLFSVPSRRLKPADK